MGSAITDLFHNWLALVVAVLLKGEWEPVHDVRAVETNMDLRTSLPCRRVDSCDDRHGAMSSTMCAGTRDSSGRFQMLGCPTMYKSFLEIWRRMRDL